MKSKYIVLISVLFSIVNGAFGQELADELLVLHSTTNKSQMDNVSGAITGSMVYNIENTAVYFYEGSKWKKYDFVPTPFITNRTEETINAGQTKTVVFTGVDFTQNTLLTISGFDGTINSISIFSPTRIEVNITANSSGLFDIVVENDGNINTSWTGNGVAKLRVN